MLFCCLLFKRIKKPEKTALILKKQNLILISGQFLVPPGQHLRRHVRPHLGVHTGLPARTSTSGALPVHRERPDRILPELNPGTSLLPNFQYPASRRALH